MFWRQPLFYPILMCSTFHSLQTPALRCRSNAGVWASCPQVRRCTGRGLAAGDQAGETPAPQAANNSAPPLKIEI